MQLNLAAINQAFIQSDLIKAVHPYLINEGECYKWAFCAYCLYGGRLYSTRYHAFIKLGERYFDSEALQGVLDWRELRVNQECKSLGYPCEAEEMDEEAFLSDWSLDPSGLSPLLAEIKAILREDK
jgi:hypothetical protein